MKLSVPCARLAVTLVFCSSIAAHGYERGDWIWRASMLQQAPTLNGDELTNGYPGAQFQFGTELMPALQFDYFLFDGVSLAASVPIQPLNQNIFIDGDNGSVRAGRAEILPLTLSLNWYLPKISNLRPYLIGAWQYAWVVNDSERAGIIAGLEDIEVDNGSGAGGGIGLEWDRDGNWSWNFSAVQFSQSQDVRVSFSGNQDTLDAHPDPLMMNLGIARRF